MSGDPLMAHSVPEHQRTKEAWFFAGVCQFWIWLNALGALAFRFWVVARFNYTTYVEEKFWPGLFFLESLLQLGLAIIVGLGLLTTPRDRKFWGFVAAAVFSVLVDGTITAAWAMVIVPEEYRLAATFGLFGSYLTIPAIGFAVYCCLVTPGPFSVWIYAVTLTIAVKCAAIILITVSSLAFISYTVIILIALLSVALPLKFGFAKNEPRLDANSSSLRSSPSAPLQFMPKISAGLLMYRRRNEHRASPEVLLAHPGSPFWRNKDDGAWMIPKGEVEEGEELLAAAIREFTEETGLTPVQPFLALGQVKHKSGKTVHAWAFQGDCDPTQIRSNTFELEWPPKSGRKQEFPEIDRAEFFDLSTARRKMLPAELPLLDRFAVVIGDS